MQENRENDKWLNRSGQRVFVCLPLDLDHIYDGLLSEHKMSLFSFLRCEERWELFVSSIVVDAWWIALPVHGSIWAALGFLIVQAIIYLTKSR
jgi:hypothetical protein